MSIDWTIGVGDMVTVGPLKVVDVGPSTLKLTSRGGPVFCPREAVTSHTPAPREITVGDRVQNISRVMKGTVEHVAFGRAWVWWDNGDTGIWFLPSLAIMED